MSSLISSSASDPKESLTPTPPQRQRCPHVSRNGRPCRYLAASLTEPHCKYHLPENSTEVFRELLEKMAQNFDTPEGVSNVLYTIFFWAATGYISERKAATLTYVAQTLLNSQRVDLQLQKLLAESEERGLPIYNPYNSATTSEEEQATPPLPTTTNPGC
ncbi:MAG TPA: hypothetical protein VJX72_06335 [Candidatus Acidoferrum sp.]|nr:hypothetical protein [Candidatus Acidoferrum sp.]